jgi:DNA polymerase-3 subunit beta
VDSVPAKYAGPELSIGFNAQYVGDFLNAMSTEFVSMGLKDAESQAILKPVDGGETDYRCVLMPVRL